MRTERLPELRDRSFTGGSGGCARQSGGAGSRIREGALGAWRSGSGLGIAQGSRYPTKGYAGLGASSLLATVAIAAVAREMSRMLDPLGKAAPPLADPEVVERATPFVKAKVAEQATDQGCGSISTSVEPSNSDHLSVTGSNSRGR